MSTPLQIPELLIQIGEFLDHPSLVSLSYVDRFSYTVATPLLLRQVSISLKSKSFPLFASAIRSNPSLPAFCKSLSFSNVQPPYSFELQENLVAILNATCVHRNLASLWLQGMLNAGVGQLPERVWTAIAASGSSVEVLKLCMRIVKAEWMPLTNAHFPRLRVFHLDVRYASSVGTDYAPLQHFLESLSDLEDLDIYFPVFHSAPGMPWQFRHPCLKRFSIRGGGDVGNSNFLARNPQIQTLRVHTEQAFEPVFDSSIHTLNLDSKFPNPWRAIIHSPIVHLCLRDVSNYPQIQQFIRATQSTLRCLEIQFLGHSGDRHFPDSVLGLINIPPTLDELAVLGTWKSGLNNAPCAFPDTMIHEILGALGPNSSLRALRVRCSKDFSLQNHPDALGQLPPFLKYISCEVHYNTKCRLYLIDREDGKGFVSEMLRRRSPDDWAEKSVLRYFGEAWTQ
ncbi:hypothetical protein R3P38DRAFT_3277579 [Favolaschia claudopus]|uniref:F-box domain-containing protein n=1 Tax=Favolaschia claudopus TaxID=2862362 RepID=A0AAW0AKN9_9AGAR